MKRINIVILVLLLVIGFAAVSTTLILNGIAGIGTSDNDFDIYFSEAILDSKDISAEAISSDGKTINFATRELTIEGEETTLAYKVKNSSTQYDADVTIKFTFENQDKSLNEFIEVTNSMTDQKIYSGEEKEGFLIIKLKKAVVEKMQVSIKCEIKADAIEKNKDRPEFPGNKEDSYSFYGFLKNEDNNIVENGILVIYSDEVHYTQSDERGYFYVNGLKEGSQEIYYLTGNLEEIKQLKKSQVKENAISNVNITTSTKKIILSNNYKIDNYTIEIDTERKYDITLNPNGGNLDSTIKEVIQNREYGNLPTTMKEGYTFQGWYLNDQKIKSYLLVIPKETHTLEARWSINSYEISFDSMDGTKVSSIYKNHGETFGELPTPTKEGCNFQGWYTEPNGGTKIDENYQIKITSNQKLYAHWSEYKETILNGNDPLLKGGLIPVIIANNGDVTYASPSDQWYSYSEKKWANAVILEEGVSYKAGDTIPEEAIESYFVWIPRYKYQIFDEGNYTSIISSKPSSNVAKEIQIVFENKNVSTSNGSTKGSWLTHPAFTNFDVNGLWVGKFEMGYKGATTKEAAQVNAVDSSKVIIKPNVYSWRNISVSNLFKTAYNYKRDLNSHMMKNTEWGAIVYLSHSKYGINKEININNNANYLTGYSATINTDQSSYPGISGTEATITLPYNTSTGYQASTTGNITGIYDMSGGSSELVAAYNDGYGTSSSGFTASELTTYAKYLDKYISNTSKSATVFNYRILGDATGELGPFYGYADNDGGARSHNNWYADRSNFIERNNPWFFRGGGASDGVLAGGFYFASCSGAGASSSSSHLVLAPNV